MNVTDGIIYGTIDELNNLTEELEMQINLMEEDYEIVAEDEYETRFYILTEREEDVVHFYHEKQRELFQDEYECDSYNDGFTESKDIDITSIR